jgi:DNA-binding Lrp family transcriptional regulator
LNLPQAQIINIINYFCSEGLIRKFGAVLRHQKAGFSKNALVIWSVPELQTNKIGEAFASLPFVSHCYERSPAFEGKYNLFTMVHSRDKDISALASSMSSLSGMGDFMILKSLQEYKKSSPEYF